MLEQKIGLVRRDVEFDLSVQLNPSALTEKHSFEPSWRLQAVFVDQIEALRLLASNFVLNLKGAIFPHGRMLSRRHSAQLTSGVQAGGDRSLVFPSIRRGCVQHLFRKLVLAQLFRGLLGKYR